MPESDNQTYVKLPDQGPGVWLIYSRKQMSWYGPECCGYSYLAKAGRYTEEVAKTKSRIDYLEAVEWGSYRMRQLCRLNYADRLMLELYDQLAEAQASIQNMRAALLCHGSAVDALNDRDWPEDFAHENGKYNCKCCVCGEYFVGYKRRVGCKACAFKHMQAIIDKLPRTADGVVYITEVDPYRGDSLWFIEDGDLLQDIPVDKEDVSKGYSTYEAAKPH